jgi:hypothetical protein
LLGDRLQGDFARRSVTIHPLYAPFGRLLTHLGNFAEFSALGRCFVKLLFQMSDEKQNNYFV